MEYNQQPSANPLIHSHQTAQCYGKHLNPVFLKLGWQQKVKQTLLAPLTKKPNKIILEKHVSIISPYEKFTR